MQTEPRASFTVRVDAGLLREARLMAAQRGTTVGRLLAEQLEALVRSDKAYAASRRRAIGRMKKAKALGWRKPTSRDELHER